MLLLTEEEAEILNLIDILLSTQKTLIETYVRKLKQYDSNIFDKDVRDRIENVLAAAEEIPEAEDPKDYIDKMNFKIDLLYMSLNSKKKVSEEVFKEEYDKFLKIIDENTNLVLTEEVKNEARAVLKEELTKEFQRLKQLKKEY